MPSRAFSKENLKPKAQGFRMRKYILQSAGSKKLPHALWEMLPDRALSGSYNGQ